MARPLKEGLEYFPLDCVMDREVKLLEAEFQLNGFGAYIKLLQEAYQTKDGEIKYLYNKEFSAGKMYGKQWDIPAEKVDEMVFFMVEVGLFNKERFKKDGVLTSNGIKKRIFKINDDRRIDRQDKSIRRGKHTDNTPTMPEKEKKKENKKEISKKRPAFFVIQEYKVLKMDKQRIKDILLERKYSEHEIEEGFYESDKKSKVN